MNEERANKNIKVVKPQKFTKPKRKVFAADDEDEKKNHELVKNRANKLPRRKTQTQTYTEINSDDENRDDENNDKYEIGGENDICLVCGEFG